MRNARLRLAGVDRRRNSRPSNTFPKRKSNITHFPSYTWPEWNESRVSPGLPVGSLAGNRAGNPKYGGKYFFARAAALIMCAAVRGEIKNKIKIKETKKSAAERRRE
jgi:hypothetical protein